MQNNSRRSWPFITINILLWLIILLVWTQRQNLYDSWRLRGYNPPSEIVAIADATTMNDKSRKLFFVNHPTLEDSNTFNQHCRDGEFTIVLGCYISNQKGIFIFVVNDPRLDGIEEVTAAHELLHAAYDRISDKERAKVDKLIGAAFKNSTNQRIKDTVAEYVKNDPSTVPNELHSILGTEEKNLSVELENYYKKYFNDRSRIVTLSEAYEAAFGERKALIEKYETDLKALQAKVEQANKDLQVQGDNLKIEYQQLESKRNSDSAEVFNAQAASYNAKVQAYNRQVTNTSNLIDRYNEIYKKYSQIVLEQQDLFSAIDSRPKALQAQ